MPYRQNFPIPSEIDPPQTCLCIPIPDSTEWRAIVAGLLGELTYWFNYERTGDGSGSECAAVWKDIFTRIDWSNMSCCCDQIPLQFQYTDVGVLQVSIDGGLTFVDSPERDVRNNSPKFPPIPGDDGSDKKCAAATGAANLVKEQIGDQLTDDMGRYTLNQLVSDWTHTMIDTSNPFTALVTVVANQIFALVISAVRAALTDDVYHLFACALYCSMGDDASFNDAQWENARTRITDTISGIAGVFLEHLVYLLGKVGTTNLTRSAPDDTGDCSDCECSPCIDQCATEWTWYGVHDVVFDGCNLYTMKADGGGAHVAFSSGSSAVGCYAHDGGFNTGTWWPVGSGSPVGGTNPRVTQVWNWDGGDPVAETVITMQFSSAPI